MKFYTSGLSDLISQIQNGKIKSLLMHGPNQGFISTAIELLEKKLSITTHHYCAKDLSPNQLLMIANNKNFFGQRELIKITDTTGVLSKEMKEMLMVAEFYHFVCFVSADSLPPSGIRKFFEEQSYLAVLACYFDNEQTIAKLILEQCKKRNIQIDEEALFYLKNHLKTDHQIIKSELEKLFLYTHDKTIITKEDVLASLSFEDEANGDEMCVYFAKKDSSSLLNEIDKLKQNGINEVLMLRALLRYFFNIYSVAARIEDGENIDRAIKLLSPPIFFKYIDDFKQVIRLYSSSDALKYIEILQSAEASYKQNSSTFDLFSIYLALQGEV